MGTTWDTRLPVLPDDWLNRLDGRHRVRKYGRVSPPSASPPADDQLVRTLYAEYATPLLAFVSRLTGGDQQWAEDVVQETLLRAWKNASKLDVSGSRTLRPWLCTVARRIVIDEHRSRQARPNETDDSALEQLPAHDETDKVAQRMTVTAAMNSLSIAHREVLVETFVRDRSVSEAAQRLGLPPGTVKSRVYYALRSLRDALNHQGVTS